MSGADRSAEGGPAGAGRAPFDRGTLGDRRPARAWSWPERGRSGAGHRDPSVEGRIKGSRGPGNASAPPRGTSVGFPNRNEPVTGSPYGAMPTRVVDGRTVRELLDYPACIDRMAEALRTLAEGKALQPLRSVLPLPRRSALLGLMPGALAEPETVGVKLVTVFPENREAGRPSHQGIVVLFDPQDGSPLALFDATSITEIRTAAVSALASRELARPDARTVAILGSGTQAGAHARALKAVRPVDRVAIWDRRPERAAALAARLRSEGLPAEVATDREPAVRDAAIVCTTTASRTPLLEGEWLAPGTHVNAVGASAPGFRELATTAVVRARVFVDRRESAWAEADDLRVPLAEGAISAGHVVGELGEVLVGRIRGRERREEVTVFKSLGLAVEDLVAARYLLDRAVALGRGSLVELAPSGRAGGG